MKQLFVLCAFLLHLFGNFSAEAKAPVQTKAEGRKENSKLSSFSFHHDHPADLTQTTHFHSITGKVRDQRTLPGFINGNGPDNAQPAHTDNQPIVCPFPTFIPLVRLLLFPEHYFW